MRFDKLKSREPCPASYVITWTEAHNLTWGP